MSEDDIKSAQQVISEFVESLPDNSDLDPETVAAITSLHSEDKLTKTNLIRTLENRRTAALTPDPHSLNEGTAPDD